MVKFTSRKYWSFGNTVTILSRSCTVTMRYVSVKMTTVLGLYVCYEMCVVIYQQYWACMCVMRCVWLYIFKPR